MFDPNNTMAYFKLCEIYKEEGNFEQARNYALMTLEKDPNFNDGVIINEILPELDQ